MGKAAAQNPAHVQQLVVREPRAQQSTEDARGLQIVVGKRRIVGIGSRQPQRVAKVDQDVQRDLRKLG